MKNTFLLFMAITASLLLPNSKSNAQESLYKRLGGYDAIAAVTDDFLARLTTNDQLKKFFGGLNTTDQLRVRQHIVDFLCAKTGGPCVYTGLDMKATHAGLNITESDWNVSNGLLMETLKKFNVPKKETDEVMAFVATLKGDIVTKP